MFFPLIFSIIVFCILLLLMLSSQKKLEIEGDKKPLYESTAGGEIGWMKVRGPFISLRIYDEFIIIACGKKMVLKYDEVLSVAVLMPGWIQINHHNPTVPKNILIGTHNPAQAKEIIDARLSKQAPS